jgi:hypothetical protein
MSDERHKEQHKENHKQDFRDSGRSHRDSRKAQYRRDQRDDKESNRPIQHAFLLSCATPCSKQVECQSRSGLNAIRCRLSDEETTPWLRKFREHAIMFAS